MSRLSHAIGFDDAPFDRAHRGDVRIVATVYAHTTLHGVLTSRVRRDGANSTRVLAGLVKDSPFAAHLQLIFLQGVALAGFNVVDAHALHRLTGLPVVVVARRQPDYARVRAALLGRVPGGARKWRLIERLGPTRPVAGVWVQCVGIDVEGAGAAVERFRVTGNVPEPLRAAHLIAGALGRGVSRGRT
ncbi:DUF99 family protein [Deinococcus pimensis]|uniref:endonuclease dU n=1 Tax=Deinococcus pimensis TaxID=309888 RepID=UPI0004B7A716